MSRKILLVAALIVFAISGQAQSTSQSTPYNGPFGGPILMTPNASFPNPPPTAGISDAGRAGISANTSGAASETVPVTTTTTTTVTESVPASAVPSTAAPVEIAPTNELNPSVSINNPSAVTAPIGVAEAANRYKTDKATFNARVLNNENVLLIVNRNSSDRSMALNMLPTEQNGQPQSADAQASSAPQAGSAQAGSAQAGSVQSSTAAAPSQAQPANAQTNTDNATTPQINQNQESNDAQGTTRLPATATFLPLLGLLGLASGGFGLLVRKFRK